jgi:tetratricopeptide (TPR) repeat protein
MWYEGEPDVQISQFSLLRHGLLNVKISNHNSKFILCCLGASFRIESCTFDEEDNLWHVIVQATDQGAALASEYIEYQKKKMADANIVLMFGHLLVEMGEYGKAEKYFDTVLASNPNDEEIACIYFNFGRAYRLKGHFDRSMECYLYAYNLHDKAKPKRLASAAKALNGVGVSQSELGNQEKAIACFNKALKLLHMSVQRNHIDIAGTLINLASIHCERKEVRGNIFFPIIY